MHQTNNKMSSIVKGKDMDVSNVTFAAPRVLDSGAKLVWVNYKQSMFNIQTPWMSLPWEMKEYSDNEVRKFTLTLSFNGINENPKLQAFHDRMVELEKKIIEGGVTNSMAWFKKKGLSKEVVENLFNPIIKVSTDKETGEPDGKWPPSMRAKVPYRVDKDTGEGVFGCKVFNAADMSPFNINGNNPQHDLADVFVKGAKVRCLLQCVGLWIASGNYMCQWKVTKAEVELPEGYGNDAFLPESEDEGEGEETTSGATTTNNFIEDSEEEPEAEPEPEPEEEPEAEPEPEPEPEPTPKKAAKKVRKKVVKK